MATFRDTCQEMIFFSYREFEINRLQMQTDAWLTVHLYCSNNRKCSALSS